MDIVSITSRISDTIEKVFGLIRQPAKKIPSILMICSLLKRPGLSAIVSFGNIMTSLSEKGVNIQINSDGSYDETGIIIKTILDEIYRALREDASIQGVTMPGSMSFTGTGGNAGGPVQVVGTNVTCGEMMSAIK